MIYLLSKYINEHMACMPSGLDTPVNFVLIYVCIVFSME